MKTFIKWLFASEEVRANSYEKKVVMENEVDLYVDKNIYYDELLYLRDRWG